MLIEAEASSKVRGFFQKQRLQSESNVGVPTGDPQYELNVCLDYASMSRDFCVQKIKPAVPSVTSGSCLEGKIYKEKFLFLSCPFWTVL